MLMVPSDTGTSILAALGTFWLLQNMAHWPQPQMVSIWLCAPANTGHLLGQVRRGGQFGTRKGAGLATVPPACRPFTAC